METLRFSVPCLFGLEGLAAKELRRLRMDAVQAENGRVGFSGGVLDLARANVNLRCGERVLLELGRFPAESFEALFQGVRALPWERFIPRDGRFPVKGHSLTSALHSVPDCQKIIKKAVAARLGEKYGLERLPETGELYQIQFSILKDEAALFLDTSGAGLHKRGYRPAHLEAPLRETLAAAMVELARFRGKEDFCDPFCGSGTIPIEAALTAKNRAPGLMRDFSARHWKSLPPEIWREAETEARDGEFHGKYRIFASDIDSRAVDLARKNAARAGVEGDIAFSVADACAFGRRTDRGSLVTNPPYGQRLLEREEAEELYRDFGAAMGGAERWQALILSSHPEFERFYGRSAAKKRKLYNGMIPCTLYQFPAK